MKTTVIKIPINKVRDRLMSLPEEIAAEPGVIAVISRGEPVLAILPWALYESIMETLEILSDEELMATLRQGVKEASEGKAVPWVQGDLFNRPARGSDYSTSRESTSIP